VRPRRLIGDVLMQVNPRGVPLSKLSSHEPEAVRRVSWQAPRVTELITELVVA